MNEQQSQDVGYLVLAAFKVNKIITREEAEFLLEAYGWDLEMAFSYVNSYDFCFQCIINERETTVL